MEHSTTHVAIAGASRSSDGKQREVDLPPDRFSTTRFSDIGQTPGAASLIPWTDQSSCPNTTEGVPDGASSSSPAPLPLLIVDDAVDETDAFVRLLASDGFEVHCTKLGFEGLRLARSGRFAAAILDLHLPDLAGMTVLNELSKTETDLPIIVVTGRYLRTDHEELAAKLGAAQFLLKPLDAQDVASAVRLAIIEKRKAVREGGPDVTRTREHPRSPDRAFTPTRPSDPLLSLHSLAVSGDRSAIEQIARELFRPLIVTLRCRWQNVEQEWVNDAVTDAIIEYIRRPGHFDPARGVPLRVYVRLAADKNLLNRIDSERRRSNREARLDDFDVAVSSRDREELRQQLTRLALITGEFTAPERAVFHLWLQGERNTADFANALAIDTMPMSCQRTEVRKVKERLRQRVRRWLMKQNNG